VSPFLEIPEADWVAHNALAFAFRDRFPVGEGHTLVVTRREVPSWFEAPLVLSRRPPLEDGVLLLSERKDGNHAQGILRSRRVEAYLLSHPDSGPDAGLPEVGTPRLEETSCGCHAARSASAPGLLFAVLALVLAGRLLTRRSNSPKV